MASVYARPARSCSSLRSDLSGAAARHFVEDRDLPWHFVVRQILSDMLLEYVRGSRRAGIQNHERGQSLTVLLVVDADHRRLRYLGVRRQRLLHLDRIDVLTAGDDHLVVAADDEQPPRVIEVTDIARRHEALVEILGLAGGVAVELGGVADVDAADLAGGHLA